MPSLEKLLLEIYQGPSRSVRVPYSDRDLVLHLEKLGYVKYIHGDNERQIDYCLASITQKGREYVEKELMPVK